MTLDVRDVRRAVSEWMARHDSLWPIPESVTVEALQAFRIEPSRVTELLLRYLGAHDEPQDVARALALIARPDVSLYEWPFAHIDWVAAAESARVGTSPSLKVFQGHYWFDGSDASLYEGSLEELDALMN